MRSERDTGVLLSGDDEGWGARRWKRVPPTIVDGNNYFVEKLGSFSTIGTPITIPLRDVSKG